MYTTSPKHVHTFLANTLIILFFLFFTCFKCVQYRKSVNEQRIALQSKYIPVVNIGSYPN